MSDFIQQNQIERVFVMATQTTVTQNLYANCAAEVFYPSVGEQRKVEGVIGRVLEGKYWQRDIEYLKRLAQIYKVSKRADAFLLGCTELSVLFKETKPLRRIRTIDPLKILANKLLK